MEIHFYFKIVLIWRYIASSGLYKVVVMKLFIDGADLCLIVLHAWDSGVLWWILTVTPPMHGMVGPYPG